MPNEKLMHFLKGQKNGQEINWIYQRFFHLQIEQFTYFLTKIIELIVHVLFFLLYSAIVLSY